MGKALRPSGALRSVALLGRAVIDNVYPLRLAAPQDTLAVSADVPRGEPTCTIANPSDGVLLAFDIQGLVSLAERADCVIELVPQVGDFVAAEDPLFRVFQGRATLTPHALCQSVALGQERTVEQAPTFAFRIMVDIGSEGLSPGINDPTTAVLAIDQINHLLRRELALLHRSAQRFFAEPEDRALADISDFQGVGGKQRLLPWRMEPDKMSLP